MKKFVLLIFLIVLVAGCRNMMHHSVAGSGNRKTEKRNVPAFTSISTEGAYDIEVVQGTQPSLEIEGDDNILPLITTEVSNNVLHIKNSPGYSTRKPIALKISTPSLDGISASGAGKIDVSGLKSEKFELEANGAPRITVSGETKVLEINTNGAANIDTHKLRADRAVVDSNGVSKIELHAADELDVTVSGPSNVIYHGDPHVKQSVNGPGSVTKSDSGAS